MDWQVDFLELDAGDAFNAGFRCGPAFIEFVAEAVLEPRRLLLRRCHVHGAGPGSVGVRGLGVLAAMVMERLDVDELRIEGQARTTGAGPGRKPAPLVFRRGRNRAPAA